MFRSLALSVTTVVFMASCGQRTEPDARVLDIRSPHVRIAIGEPVGQADGLLLRVTVGNTNSSPLRLPVLSQSSLESGGAGWHLRVRPADPQRACPLISKYRGPDFIRLDETISLGPSESLTAVVDLRRLIGCDRDGEWRSIRELPGAYFVTLEYAIRIVECDRDIKGHLASLGVSFGEAVSNEVTFEIPSASSPGSIERITDKR